MSVPGFQGWNFSHSWQIRLCICSLDLLLFRACSYEFNKSILQTHERKTHQESCLAQKYCLWLKVPKHRTAGDYSYSLGLIKYAPLGFTSWPLSIVESLITSHMIIMLLDGYFFKS